MGRPQSTVLYSGLPLQLGREIISTHRACAGITSAGARPAGLGRGEIDENCFEA